MTVIAKTVGKFYIAIDEQKIYGSSSSIWDIILPSLIGIFVCVVMLLSGINNVYDTNDMFCLSVVSLFVGAAIFALIYITCLTTPIFGKLVECYEIYIIGTRYSEYVYKKSPEQDQIAVCKAVHRLEIKAKELLKAENHLQNIANNCK